MGTRGTAGGALALALLVLVLVAVSAGAQRSEPATTHHLYTVPADRQGAAAIARSDARVIARYGAFTLVEAASGDAARLRRAGADLRDDMRVVRVGRKEIDPARDRAELAKPRPGSGPALAVVQFVGPIKDSWLARLRGTGVRVVSYMAENGYLVSGSAGELAELSGLAASDPAVRAVVGYAAADKLGVGIKRGGRQRVAVQTLSGGEGSPARTRVDGLHTESEMSAVGPFRTQYVELDATELTALAGDPGVISIQPAPPPKLHDEIQDQILAGAVTGTTTVVPTGPGYLAFVDGLGLGTATFPFTVDVADEGIDKGLTATDLADFHEGGTIGADSSRITYADNFTPDSDASDCGGHGTHNASIVAGFNDGTGATVENTDGFNYGLGVAPRVRVGASKIFRCSGTFGLSSSFTTLTTSAYGKGARIANHSWGSSVGGAYDARSQEFDRLVRDAQPAVPGNQEMVEVFAAGNDGDVGDGVNTVASPATAKNVIAVGAAESVRASGTDGCGVTNSGADDAHDMAFFSSRGPTDDGRFKPDIVAPGTHITAAQSHASGYDGNGVCNPAFPAASTLYNLSSGTSHSAPAVAGMAALFREWFRQKKGGGTITPSPALTKAALANSASDLTDGVGAGGSVPNNDQGWGNGNLTRLLDTGPRYFCDQETTFGATGESFVRTLAVQDPSKPVRVTLAWTDRFGPTSGSSWVNNLDLQVAGTAGTFRGNVFSGGVSVTGGTADPRNNLEAVYLPAGTSGSLTVSVTAANIAGDAVPGNADPTDQDFALVVSNASEDPTQPGGLIATPGADSIALDWSDVPLATGYEVFRRAEPGAYPASATATPASSDFLDGGLTAGQRYCYMVRALNGETPGPLSDEVCATVPARAAAQTPPTAPPALDLSSFPRSVTVGTRGVFFLSFGATAGHAGTIRLKTVSPVGAGQRRLVVARKSFISPIDGRLHARIKLGRRGLRLLRRVRRLPVAVKVTLGPATATRRLTLRAPQPRRRL
jgi:hypothetical protein